MNRPRLILWTWVCLVWSLTPGAFAWASPSSPLANKRVIFEEDVFWTKPQEADRILQRIRDAGFTTFVVNVWHGRGAMWPSSFAPRDSWAVDQRNPAYDPLAYLIRRAKAMDIEIHAWFTVTLRQSELFPQFAPEGAPEKAFNIHDPDFHRLMADLVAEVISGYEVAGINLDYIRTMGFCRSSKCRTAYFEAYHRDLLEDIRLFQGLPINAMRKTVVPSLIEFQDVAVRKMVETVSQRVRRLDPHLMLSVDALPGEIGLEQGQNSLKWLNDGLIDAVFRMDYSPNPNFTLLETLRKQLTNPNALTLLISNIDHKTENGERKFFPRGGRWLEETVGAIGSRWPQSGFGLYMSKFLSDEQIIHLRKGPGNFPDHEPPPTPKGFSVD